MCRLYLHNNFSDYEVGECFIALVLQLQHLWTNFLNLLFLVVNAIEKKFFGTRQMLKLSLFRAHRLP